MTEKNEKKTPIKELISEESFDIKLGLCAGHALKVCFTSFFVGIIGIPMVLKGLRVFRIPLEARVAVGVLSGLPIIYYTGKAARENCMNEVKETYRYK